MPSVAQLRGSISIVGAAQAAADLNKVNTAQEKVASGGSKAASGINEMNQRAKEGGGAFSALKNGIMAGIGAAAGFAGLNLTMGGVIDAIKDTIGEASSLQTIMTQTNAVLASTKDASGLTAASVHSLSESLSDATGISDQAIQSAVNLELSYSNLSGKAIPGVTQTVLDMATAMNHGALPSMDQLDSTAKIVGRALNDPARGMTMLTREGVTLSASQQAAVKAMEKAGNTAGAQGIILDALKTKYGGSADAAGNTFAGAQAKLGTALDHVKEQIGGPIITVLTKLATAVTPLVNDFAGAIPGAIAKTQGVFQWISDHGPLVSGAFVAIAAGVLGAFLPSLIALIPPLGVAAAELIATATAAIATAAPFIAVGAAVAGLVGLIILLYDRWKPFHDLIDKGRAVLQTVAGILGNVLGHALQTAGNLLSWLGQNVLPPLTKAFQFVGGIIGWLVGTYFSLLGTELSFIGGVIGWVAGVAIPPIIKSFQAVGTVIGWLVQNVAQPAFSWLGTAFGKVGSFIGTVCGKIGDAFSALGGVVRNAWNGIVGFIVQGINLAIDGINQLISAVDKVPGVSIGQIAHVSVGSIGGGGSGGGGGSSSSSSSSIGAFNLGSLFGGLGSAPGASGTSSNASGNLSAAQVAAERAAMAGSGSGSGAPGSGGKHGGGSHHKAAKKGSGSGASSTIPSDIMGVSQSGVQAAISAARTHNGLHGAALDNAILPAVTAAAEAAGAKLGVDKSVADMIAAKDAQAVALAANNKGQLTKSEIKQAIKEGAQAGVTAASKAIASAVQQGTQAASKTIALTNDQIDLASQIAAMLGWQAAVR